MYNSFFSLSSKYLFCSIFCLQVFVEDSGNFAAVIENRAGKAKCSANLVVEERTRVGGKGAVPPSFVNTIQSTIVKTGQLARFDARIAGTKPLDVYWLKVTKNLFHFIF